MAQVRVAACSCLLLHGARVALQMMNARACPSACSAAACALGTTLTPSCPPGLCCPVCTASKAKKTRQSALAKEWDGFAGDDDGPDLDYGADYDDGFDALINEMGERQLCVQRVVGLVVMSGASSAR